MNAAVTRPATETSTSSIRQVFVYLTGMSECRPVHRTMLQCYSYGDGCCSDDCYGHNRTNHGGDACCTDDWYRRLAVYIEYRRVTDGRTDRQTDGQTDRHLATT